MLNLGQLQDFTGWELDRLNAACAEVNRALSDAGFGLSVLKTVFDNTDDTSAQIFAKILAVGTITRLYCENLGWWATHVSRTIAAEAPDGSVTFNRAYFDTQDIPSLANTLLHEACHVAGYSHRSPQDSASVPYGAGNLLEAWLRAQS